MPKIVFNDATCRELRNLAISPFRSDATPLPGGNWLVPLAQDTWAVLDARRLPSESDDDLVARIIRFYRNERPN